MARAMHHHDTLDRLCHLPCTVTPPFSSCFFPSFLQSSLFYFQDILFFHRSLHLLRHCLPLVLRGSMVNLCMALGLVASSHHFTVSTWLGFKVEQDTHLSKTFWLNKACQRPKTQLFLLNLHQPHHSLLHLPVPKCIFWKDCLYCCGL